MLKEERCQKVIEEWHKRNKVKTKKDDGFWSLNILGKK